MMSVPLPAEKALTIYEVLRSVYGERPWQSHGEPIEELISTILSQNTSDANSGRAYRLLQEAFPTWEAIRDAPAAAIAEAIRVGGLAHIKAPRIQEVLRQIYAERGSFDLGFLRTMPVAEARAWLLSLRGVGPKTASCVLLFSLGLPALPVDTHVHRMSLRLGLVPLKTSPERTSGMLEAMLPAELYYPFHMHLIRHGREVCRSQRPRCEVCPLAPHCDYFQRVHAQRPATTSP